MKFTIAFAILAAVSPAIASPVGVSNGVIVGGVPAINQRAACNADNVLRALRNPTRSVGASAFCSLFLQPTATEYTTSTITDFFSATIANTVTVPTTATITDTETATTLLCPASPTATLTTCNYPAYGYGQNLISQNPNTTPLQCQQMCLGDPNCKSYQIEEGGQQYCNLYNQPTSGYVLYAPDDIYYFFDRDCNYNSAPGCTTQQAPPKEKRDAPIPSYLATVPATRISSACSCFISSPAPTATSTVVIPAAISVTTKLTAAATVTGTVEVTITETTSVYSTALP